MATYVNLAKFTEQGIRNYKDTLKRAEEYWSSIDKAGGRVLHQVWTLGEYDVVTMLEAPDDETAAALAARVSSLGNVRITTLRGFTPDEMRKILARS
jgi:uncharacterized protein with GYD domain